MAVYRKAKKGRCVFFTRNIPISLKQHFKAWCTLRGISMSDKMIQLMKETVAKDIPMDRFGERKYQ